MSRKRLQWVALCGLLLPLGLAGGCTNSEGLDSGVGALTVTVEATNTQTRFAVASLSFGQVTATPLDPSQAAVVAVGDPVGLLASTSGGADINFNGTQTSFDIGSVPPAGLYRVESIILQSIRFQGGTPSATPTNCVGAVTNYNVVNTVTLSGFSSSATFNVDPTSGGGLKLVIDGAALADAFERSWTCGCMIGSNCFQGPSCGPSQRCAVSFQPGTFAAQSPTFLQFQ